MTANAGYHAYATGDVLTAAQVQYNLQNQTVMYFATTTARDTALSGKLVDGMCAYTPATGVLVYISATSTWTSLGSTLPSQTGNAGKYLTTDGSATSWGTVSGGGMTLISETVASSLTSLSLSSIPQTYKQLMLVWDGVYSNTSNTGFGVRLNASTSLYENRIIYINSSGGVSTSGSGSGSIGTTLFGYNVDGSVWSPGSVTTTHGASGFLVIDNYASTTKMKPYWTLAGYESAYNGVQMVQGSGFWASTSAVTSIDVFRDTGSGTFSNTTDNSIRLYGIS